MKRLNMLVCEVCRRTGINKDKDLKDILIELEEKGVIEGEESSPVLSPKTSPDKYK